MLVKLELLGYHTVKKLMICETIFIWYRNVTDRWTDRQTDGQICYINIERQSIERQYADVR